jgi:hypothetical protein
LNDFSDPGFFNNQQGLQQGQQDIEQQIQQQALQNVLAQYAANGNNGQSLGTVIGK